MIFTPLMRLLNELTPEGELALYRSSAVRQSWSVHSVSTSEVPAGHEAAMTEKLMERVSQLFQDHAMVLSSLTVGVNPVEIIADGRFHSAVLVDTEEVGDRPRRVAVEQKPSKE